MNNRAGEVDGNAVVRISPDQMCDFVAAILRAEGLGARDADIMAGCLVRADLRGVDTHGIVRLPIYLDRLGRGLINPAPQLVVEQVTPVAARIDGQNGFGFVVATRAMEAAVRMAEVHGLGLVAVRRSTHYGMAACYLLQAVEAGFLALAFTNASPAMPPWGGRTPLMGTSPLGAGVPGGKKGPFVLDMAPSVAARGKIRKALSEGRPIPEGYALDEAGRPTTDPAAAMKGVVLPMAGPKGSGLAVLMDILCGVFTGAAFGGEVGNQYEEFDRPQDVGHFFLAIRPGLFMDEDTFRARMDTLVERIKASPRAEGFDEILIAGEPEARREARNRAEGIPYRRADLAPLLAIADRLELAPPGFAKG